MKEESWSNQIDEVCPTQISCMSYIALTLTNYNLKHKSPESASMVSSTSYCHGLSRVVDPVLSNKAFTVPSRYGGALFFTSQDPSSVVSSARFLDLGSWVFITA